MNDIQAALHPADKPSVTIDIMTLFPDIIEAVMSSSVIGKARMRGYIDIRTTNIRDYSPTPNRRTDDYPYGGGRGLVMLAEPLYLCHKALCERAGGHVHTVLMSAQGRPFTQSVARELYEREHIILVCGHYEGVDQRFIDKCVDEEICIGDFVVTGGEIPAMAVADCICRMAPGVLSEEVCFTDESHWNGLLEYPQYTRPELWRGLNVPPVLLSGHHANVKKWQHEKALMRTLMRRPDLIFNGNLSIEDRMLLKKLMDNPPEENQ